MSDLIDELKKIGSKSYQSMRNYISRINVDDTPLNSLLSMDAMDSFYIDDTLEYIKHNGYPLAASFTMGIMFGLSIARGRRYMR